MNATDSPIRAKSNFHRTGYRSLILVCLLMTRLGGATADPYERTPVFGLPKKMPQNALVSVYSPEMAGADQLLAEIFGGPGAIAAANSFEPQGLSNQYPLYRGDILGDNGRILAGHLSRAMHLYGSPDGRGETSIYVPAGYASHSGAPTPTDAAVTFFYPRLGNFKNVTLAVFHIANFAISHEGTRDRIGTIGGRGGSYAFYKHSHIEFYRGNTGLPSASARQRLRISPTSIFKESLNTASRAGGTSK